MVSVLRLIQIMHEICLKIYSYPLTVSIVPFQEFFGFLELKESVKENVQKGTEKTSDTLSGMGDKAYG